MIQPVGSLPASGLGECPVHLQLGDGGTLVVDPTSRADVCPCVGRFSGLDEPLHVECSGVHELLGHLTNDEIETSVSQPSLHIEAET